MNGKSRDTGKVWRLLKILTLIQGRPHLRAKDLAERCEVSERTIFRDIRDLNLAGVPVYFSDGGYQVSQGFFLPPLHLGVAEAVALTVAGSPFREPGHGHYGEAVGTALDKIAAVLPAAARRLAEEAKDRIVVDLRPLDDHGPADDDPIQSALQDAVLEGRRCEMLYFSFSHGETRERKVDPYGLLFRERAWYLVAHCHLRQEVVLFRVDRIRRLKVLEERFLRPEDFSIDEYMRDAWEVERGKVENVTVRFSAAVAPLIREARWHQTQVLTELPDGSLEFKVTTGGLHEMARWLVGFGGEAVVVAPAALRAEVARLAEAAARANAPDVSPDRGAKEASADG